jgi:predicted glycoside hydrolase/deacetylase ChbG (UPF0249 family)
VAARLVVNADDLGLHPSIDAGILRAHREGIVTSATLLVCGPTAPEAARAARAQGLPVGVHLALSTRLRPAAPADRVTSLAPDGRFRRSWLELGLALAAGRVRLAEVELELDAQLERARALGVQPDHLDGHQHVHLLPGVRARVEALAEREGLPLRWPASLPPLATFRGLPGGALKAAVLAAVAQLPSPGPRARRVRALGVAESGTLDEARLLALLDALPEGDCELLCHPAEGSPYVPEDPDWRYGWQQELDALISPRVQARIAERRIQRVSYAALGLTAPPPDR